MSSPLIFLFTIISIVSADKCPPIFGEFECAPGFSCKDSNCFDREGNLANECTLEHKCPLGTVCAEGKCYAQTSIKCNRHVLVGQDEAKSIISDCGVQGVCLNGQCVLDRCRNKFCEEGHLCRNGECVKMIDAFCIGHVDCGPTMECKTNKCQLKDAEPICNCQPHEICHHGQCYPNTECTSVFCDTGSYCVEGHCVSALGADCHQESCQGGTVCVGGVCVMDPCHNRCPADQICRKGECRIIEGIPCFEECPDSYLCINGHCRKDECRRRVCQLGEACEGVGCVRVADRFCTFAPRDCGHAFKCVDHKCVDELKSNNKSS